MQKYPAPRNGLIYHLPSLIAPQYLFLSFFLPLSAFMILNGTLPGFEILPIIFCLSLSVSGFNATNMVFDSEVDSFNKPRRPIPSGAVKKETAHRLGLLFYFSSIFFGFLSSFFLGVLCLVFFLVSYFYSAPPFRLRTYVWGSALTGAIVYGAVPFLAASLISIPSPHFSIFLLFFVLLFVIISNTKDFEDATGERKTGISSLVTELGERLGALVIVFFEFALLLSMAALSFSGLLPFKYIYASSFSILLLIPGSILFWNSVKQIQVKNNIIEKLNREDLKDIIFQAEGVTVSILLAVVIPLIYGLFSLTSLV